MSWAPQIIEQGREHDELLRRNGRWLFKLRLISTAGGRRATPAVPDSQRQAPGTQFPRGGDPSAHLK